MSYLIPLVTAGASAIFCALLAHRAWERRRIHLVLWTIGFALFVVASLLEAVALTSAWTGALYRAYFPVTAIMVGLLGAGTMFLVGRPSVANASLAFVAVAGVALVGLSLVDGVRTERLAEATAAGEVPTGVFASVATRILHPAIDVPAALFLVGGALQSWRASRSSSNLLIAAGALVFTVMHSLPSGLQTGTEILSAAILFHVGSLVGVALMFTGFLRSQEVGTPRAMREPTATT